MDLIYIGKITSFHGVKGEIRIKSDFEYKEKAFQIDNSIYIDNKPYQIKSYRRHKEYEMITIEGYNDLNSVLFLKNKKVYIDKDVLDLKKEQLLDQDYIGLTVISDKKEIGTIKNIYKTSLKKKILVVEYKEKEVLIPFELIKNIDIEKKKIDIEYVEGLF